MRITTRGLSPVFLVTNAIVWVSAAIIMGILSYWISQEEQPDSIIYMEVVVRYPKLPCSLERNVELFSNEGY